MQVFSLLPAARNHMCNVCCAMESADVRLQQCASCSCVAYCSKRCALSISLGIAMLISCDTAHHLCPCAVYTQMVSFIQSVVMPVPLLLFGVSLPCPKTVATPTLTSTLCLPYRCQKHDWTHRYHKQMCKRMGHIRSITGAGPTETTVLLALLFRMMADKRENVLQAVACLDAKVRQRNERYT